MEYYNIIIFIFIFIITMICFYLIISNVGIYALNNSNLNSTIFNENLPNTNTKTNTIEQQFLLLKNEMMNLKNKFDSSLNSSIEKKDSIKEIVVEMDDLNLKTNTNLDANTNNKPPIIYDPIANYDIAKLTDPLVDPRGRTSADQIPTPQVAMQFNFPTQGVLDRYHRVGLLIEIGYNNHKSENTNKKLKNKKLEMPYISDSSSINSDLELNKFVWDGFSKTSINNKKKNKANIIANSSTEQSVKSYKGVDIKENFESGSEIDSDLYEYFGSTDKTITNIYNTYSNSNLNDNQILELIGKKITDNWYKYFTSITMGNKVIKVVVHNKNRKELYCGDIIYIPELKKSYRVKIDPMDMIEYNPYFF